MSETAGDRIAAYLKAKSATMPHGVHDALLDQVEDLGMLHGLYALDVQELLRANRSLAQQIVSYGDRIIEASGEIQRATLRAAAAELRADGEDHAAEWLEERANQVGRPVLEVPE